MAASSHTWGFFSVSHCGDYGDHKSGHPVCGTRNNFTSPAGAPRDQTHIRSKEVLQSIGSSRQSEGTDQEDGQNQVRKSGGHVHSLRHANITVSTDMKWVR